MAVTLCCCRLISSLTSSFIALSTRAEAAKLSCSEITWRGPRGSEGGRGRGGGLAWRGAGEARKLAEAAAAGEGEKPKKKKKKSKD